MVKSLAIGSLQICPPIILAPMAGITDLAFRLLARQQGAPLCFTEMVSAQGLIRSGKSTLDLLRSNISDRPLGIQLFGDDPQVLAECARLAEGKFDLIDINMGCPVKKVVSGGAGSALLRNPAKVASIICAVRRATTLPLTIKIRSGWSISETSFLDVSRIAEAEGCDAITLHPRTRSQMFTEHADWGKIAELKSFLRIPVIGSGDLFTAMDISRMMESTGCDGVMIARGALGNPWIFREATEIFSGMNPLPPTGEERLSLVMDHLDSLCELYGETVAVREMRKHLSWYAKGIDGATKFRTRIVTIREKAPLREAIAVFFAQETHGRNK